MMQKEEYALPYSEPKCEDDGSYQTAGSFTHGMTNVSMYHDRYRPLKRWVSLAMLLVGLFFLGRYNSQFAQSLTQTIGTTPASAACCQVATIPYTAGKTSFIFDNIDANQSSGGFDFIQQFDRPGHGNRGTQRIQTMGKVIIQTIPDHTAPMTVDLDIKISQERLADVIEITQDGETLVFTSAQYWAGAVGPPPCISIIATISISSATNLSRLAIDTTVLPIELTRSLKLTSTEIQIHSISGRIVSETTYLDSRKIEIETRSGSITGSYPLKDLLSLKTVSGKIDVQVEPRENGDEESPGKFIANTSSGDICVDTLTSRIPNRNFISQVHSVSGTLVGAYLLGTECSIDTTSGTINVDLFGVGDSWDRMLTVRSTSGDITTNAHDYTKGLGTTRARFKVASGSINAFFSSSYQGDILAKSTSGSIDIVGENVRIIKDARPFPGVGREVTAVHGVGSSDIIATTVSGRINIGFP